MLTDKAGGLDSRVRRADKRSVRVARVCAVGEASGRLDGQMGVHLSTGAS